MGDQTNGIVSVRLLYLTKLTDLCRRRLEICGIADVDVQMELEEEAANAAKTPPPAAMPGYSRWNEARKELERGQEQQEQQEQEQQDMDS